MTTNSVNAIKIFCSNKTKAELLPLLQEAELPIVVTKSFEPNSPGGLGISFKVGTMAVEKLKKVIAMLTAKDKIVKFAITRTDGTAISVELKNLPENEQASILEKAHAMTIIDPKTEPTE